MPSSPSAQWTLVNTPVGFSNEPFIFYVTESGGFGVRCLYLRNLLSPVVSCLVILHLAAFQTALCTDVRCANPATFTFQNISGAAAGIEPAMISRTDNSGYSLIAFYDQAGSDLEWIRFVEPCFPFAYFSLASCASQACENPARFSADTSRGIAPAVQQGSGSFPYFYYADSASSGSIRSKTYEPTHSLWVARYLLPLQCRCTQLACTSAVSSSLILTGSSSTEFLDPPQMAAINGSNGLPILAYLREGSTGATNLQFIACPNQACTSASSFDFASTLGQRTCRLSITMGPGGFPMVAYCDDAFNLKVLCCFSRLLRHVMRCRSSAATLRTVPPA